jgi:hypothetical protein
MVSLLHGPCGTTLHVDCGLHSCLSLSAGTLQPVDV